MVSTRDNNNESNRLLASVDWFTVLLYVVLVIAGAVSIYAATTSSTSQVSMFDFDTFSGKQFLWIGLSFAIGFSLLLIDRRLYEAYAYPIYAIMIIILIVTAFVSPNIKGFVVAIWSCEHPACRVCQDRYSTSTCKVV